MIYTKLKNEKIVMMFSFFEGKYDSSTSQEKNYPYYFFLRLKKKISMPQLFSRFLLLFFFPFLSIPSRGLHVLPIVKWYIDHCLVMT